MAQSQSSASRSSGSDDPPTVGLRRFHIASFGCRASQSEGASISAELAAAGRRSVASPFEADVVVINSCTVTSEADRDVDRLIRRISRRNPAADIIVTGCYAQRMPEELAARPQVRYVVGNSHKSRVAALTEDCLDDPVGPGRAEVFCSQVFELGPLEHQGSSGRKRATVKVQDGCDANCTFCIIPTVRGRGRSLPAQEVIRQVSDLVEGGYPEIVFSGIHLGSWGRDLNGSGRLSDLVARTLEEVPGLERLRLSSIEPLEVTADLVRAAGSSPRVARHFHIPLQSGSQRVLRSMRRPYSPAEYTDRVRAIHEAMPEAAIGADVMVGFPGETDRDFLETSSLIESLPLSYLHVFPYSPRPGTVAADLDDEVPLHVRRFRRSALARLGTAKNRTFRRRFVGRTLPVLALGEAAGAGGQRGLSDNFIDVRLGTALEAGRWHEVWVAGETEHGLFARLSVEQARTQDSRMTTAADTV